MTKWSFIGVESDLELALLDCKGSLTLGDGRGCTSYFTGHGEGYGDARGGGFGYGYCCAQITGDGHSIGEDGDDYGTPSGDGWNQ